MPRTRDEIEADIAAIRKRMASGVSLVSVGDMTTRFDGANDTKALDLLKEELDALAAPGGAVMTRMSFTRIGMRRF